MLEFLSRLFDPDFMPHGHCYMWNPVVLWMHVGSDIAIAAAYFSIPMALLTFIRKRRDMAYPWVFFLFAAFIVSCGLTHLIDVMTTWNGAYRVEGVAKLVTALISVATAVLIWPLIPKLLELPSPAQLAMVNADLQRKIESLQMAEEVGGVGHWRVELTGPAGPQVRWSPEVYRIHGRDPAEDSPGGDEVFDDYHPDDRAEVRGFVDRAIEHQEPFEFVRRIIRANGDVRHVRCVARVELGADDEVVAIAGVLQDVTSEYERRAELERLVAERTEELRRANEDLESFAYAASHDLKEPLRMVSSYVTLLQTRFGQDLDDKAQRYIHHAVDGAARMASLIDDLLAFSRTSNVELEFESVELGPLAEEVRQSLDGSVGAHHARIELRPLPQVVAVRPVVRQVLQNLLSNAVKYGGQSPEIEVRARRDEARQQWVVSVEDDGEGIPAEQRQRIFEPLVRLHGRDHSEGTGLGLAICRRLVQRCGGEIWVEARSPRGSVFHFTLPDRDAPTARDDDGS